MARPGFSAFGADDSIAIPPAPRVARPTRSHRLVHALASGTIGAAAGVGLMHLATRDGDLLMGVFVFGAAAMAFCAAALSALHAEGDLRG